MFFVRLLSDRHLERLLHSDYSYVDTVHSSQGQTADYCIYSAANGKSLTIGRESFYVAASRARQEFVVYTASTQDLGVTVQISRANENAKDLVNSSVAREKVDNAKSESTPQTIKPQQNERSKPSLALTEQEPSNSSNEPDKRSIRNQPESNQERIGFDRVIMDFTDSSRQSEELAANLRGTNSEAATTPNKQSNSNRETEQPGNNTTENNRAAEELTREFQKLEQRAIRSHLQNRKTRKPSGTSHSRNPGQFIAKIKQLARDFFSDRENVETGEIWSSQQIGRSDDYQTPRTTQGNLDYSIDYQSVDLDTNPHQSPQPKTTSRDQGQSQQQRNPSQPNREQARQVEPSQSSPSPTAPLSQPLRFDEVNQILLTATSAIKRYGRERDKKTTFNNPYYQIEKFSVFETYGYRSYFTIDAKDGRGRILTLKGQNFHSANLKVQENRLTKQDVLTFEKIQSALDYLQQIRQFQKNATTILLNYGERNPQQPLDGTFEGQNYRIERDEKALRITAKDGRGEILNYPSDPGARYPEAKASANFNQEDVELFRTLAQQIKQERRSAERRWQKEQSQTRQQGRGLGR